MFDVTSIVMIFFYETMYIGNVVSKMWRIFFDNQLSLVLTKLEAIHEKLIHMNMVKPMKIKMNKLFITGIIIHFISSNVVRIQYIIFACFVDTDLTLGISMVIINN